MSINKKSSLLKHRARTALAASVLALSFGVAPAFADQSDAEQALTDAAKGKLKVVGAEYSLETGEVTFYDF